MTMDDGTVAQPFAHKTSTLDDVASADPDTSTGDIGDMSDTDDTGIRGDLDEFSLADATSPLTTAIRLLRPSALLLVLTPALTALALLWIRGATILPLPAIAGVVSLLLIQAGASLLDVYLEYARRAHFPEPSRIDQLTARALLARSGIQPINVLPMSIILMILGALAGIPLIATGGWPVVILGGAGLLIAFLVSATVFAIKRFSISDLIIALALGPGIVAGMMLAQRHVPTTRDLLFAGALGLLAMLPAVGAHLRDAEQDELLGRRTLVTTLGDGVGRAIYIICLVAAMALLTLAALPPGAPHGALLAFLALPAFSIPVSGTMLAGPGRARAQVVLQELRAYAIFAFWLLLGLFVNGILLRGLGPILPTV
jgi:1,4-dihydroxy-2-naphthoate polyprenyltransferase